MGHDIEIFKNKMGQKRRNPNVFLIDFKIFISIYTKMWTIVLILSELFLENFWIDAVT